MKRIAAAIIVCLATHAWGTEAYTRQLRLPCGECHVNAGGAGKTCLTGIWDKTKGRWLPGAEPKPMERCSFIKPGADPAPLTDFGVMFHRGGDKLQ